MKKTILLLLLLSPAIIFAYGKKDVGTTSAAFLKLGYGGRPTGMGDAFTSVNGDVSNLYYNPGGLISVNNKIFSFMHINWLADIKYNALSYVQPLKDNSGVFGIALGSLDYGTIDMTDEITKSKIGTYSAYDRILHISYADKIKFFKTYFDAGMNFKYIIQKIDKESAQGIAADFGGQIELQEDWRAGIMVQNIGKMSKFENENDPLPLNVKIGTSYKFIDERFLTALDINFPNDNSPYIALGAEFMLMEKAQNNFNLGIRLGYNGLNSDKKGYSLGFGLNIMQFDLDYAFLPFEELGNTHRIAVNYNFGEKMKKEEDVKPAEQRKKLTRQELEYQEFQRIINSQQPQKKKIEPALQQVQEKQKEQEITIQPLQLPVLPELSSGKKIDVKLLNELLKNGNSKMIFFRSKTAKAVSVTGTFTSWKKFVPLKRYGNTDVWYCYLELQPRKYLYKLAVDGKYIDDPSNTEFRELKNGDKCSLLVIKGKPAVKVKTMKK